MKPLEIKSEFALRGLKLVDIANQLDVSRSMVSQVAKGLVKTQRVREAIAVAMGKDPWAEDAH